MRCLMPLNTFGKRSAAPSRFLPCWPRWAKPICSHPRSRKSQSGFGYVEGVVRPTMHGALIMPCGGTGKMPSSSDRVIPLLQHAQTVWPEQKLDTVRRVTIREEKAGRVAGLEFDLFPSYLHGARLNKMKISFNAFQARSRRAITHAGNGVHRRRAPLPDQRGKSGSQSRVRPLS